MSFHAWKVLVEKGDLSKLLHLFGTHIVSEILKERGKRHGKT